MEIVCQFKDKTPFKVGTLRELTCRGDFSSLRPQLKPNGYALHSLDVKNEASDQVTFIVTSYKTGSYKNHPLQIIDGKKMINVKPLSWEVLSVLKENEVTPHPPYGPWNPALPSSYLVAWGLLFILTLSFACIRISSWKKKKRIISQVKERLKGVTPMQYFIKQMSYFITHQRSQEKDLEKLNEFFREFLENHFYISSKLSLKQILGHKTIKSDAEVVQILSEFKNSKNYSSEDVDQLVEMVRTWVFKKEHS